MPEEKQNILTEEGIKEAIRQQELFDLNEIINELNKMFDNNSTYAKRCINFVRKEFIRAAAPDEVLEFLDKWYNKVINELNKTK